MITLIGPFKEIVTLRSAPDKGPLLEKDLGLVQNGGILVAHEKILEVGSFEELRKQANLVHEVSGEQVLLPGLIDCHTHLAWMGARFQDYTSRMSGQSYEAILERGGGIFESVRKTRAATKEALVGVIKSRAIRHLQDGVTTIEVKSGYGLDVVNEIKILEAIKAAGSAISVDLISTCLAAHVCPPEFNDKASFLDHLKNELLPLLRETELSKRIDIFVEPSAFPVSMASDYLLAAKETGFDLTVHADQFHTGGSELAVKHGAMSADHLEASTSKEIKLLAASNTVAVALPGASLGLGMRFSPARKLLDAGASLAISTDWNPGSAPMGDLLVQAAILAMYEKLSPAEVFAGMTFRAAKSLGLQDRGKLVAGMNADFIAYPFADHREILYNQGRAKPVGVWKNANREY